RGGLPVFSGGARRVDQLAMAAALDAGGSVVGVLADSLERQIRKPDTLVALDGGQICLITQQHPRAGFSVGAAMGRNKLIYALADVTVVVASDRGRGGTWQGAVEALRHGYGNVAVWRGAGEGAGNTELEKSGALPLTAVERLDELASGDDAAPPVQMTMLD
ncbi:MAG TPA: DNA-processing protein DprA, partial [Actinobacteria bacterium]|nr:DNA-processing protein DprA [Actinomycetota bacterium]